MTVDAGAGNGLVVCHLQGPAAATTAGSFWLWGGYGHWASPEVARAATVTGARLTTADDTVLAAARLSS